jgi:hypothetical protein
MVDGKRLAVDSHQTLFWRRHERVRKTEDANKDEEAVSETTHAAR